MSLRLFIIFLQFFSYYFFFLTTPLKFTLTKYLKTIAHLFFILLILVSHILNQENLWHFGQRIYLFFPHLMLKKDTIGIQLYSNSWLHFGHFNLLLIIVSSPPFSLFPLYYILKKILIKATFRTLS